MENTHEEASHLGHALSDRAHSRTAVIHLLLDRDQSAFHRTKTPLDSPHSTIEIAVVLPEALIAARTAR